MKTGGEKPDASGNRATGLGLADVLRGRGDVGSMHGPHFQPEGREGCGWDGARFPGQARGVPVLQSPGRVPAEAAQVARVAEGCHSNAGRMSDSALSTYSQTPGILAVHPLWKWPLWPSGSQTQGRPCGRLESTPLATPRASHSEGLARGRNSRCPQRVLGTQTLLPGTWLRITLSETVGLGSVQLCAH